MSSPVVSLLVASLLAAGTQPAEAPPPTAVTEAESPAPAPSTTTAAPEPGKDVVHLSSGGFVRGTIEEYEPGGQVVLRKADGTVRTFEADEVARVEVGGSSTPEPAPAPAVAPWGAPVGATPAGAQPSANQARVHLVRGDSRPDDLVLQRRTGGIFVSGYGGSASGQSWVTECTSPCARPISTNGAFFINGLNKGPVLASKAFSLDPYAGSDVTIEVRGGSTGLWIGGLLLMTAGTTAAAISPLWFILDDYNRGTGAALLAAGTAGLVGGIIMMVRGRYRAKLSAGRPSGR
ncbi:MAG: hypothetical protein AB1Z98_08860 [Nannocystaceae bacterium]